MFEAFMVLVLIAVLVGFFWWSAVAKDEYPREEELDDFFWDEEYNAPRD